MVARSRSRASAWFDHQWGDFISVGGGGWDWFAVNLDDGTDLTLSLVRDADGSYPLIYGTVVERDGTVRHLDRDAFQVEVTDRWVSPTTGADYPAGWTIQIPGEDLEISSSRRSPRRNWIPARPPASSTGRARRWSGRRGPGSRWWPGVRGADGIRRGGAGRQLKPAGGPDALLGE